MVQKSLITIHIFQLFLILDYKGYVLAFFKFIEKSCPLWKLNEYWSNSFTSFISSEVLCIHFFVFVIDKHIGYQCFFDIYIDYIDCFFRRMGLLLFNSDINEFQIFLNDTYLETLKKKRRKKQGFTILVNIFVCEALFDFKTNFFSIA